MRIKKKEAVLPLRDTLAFRMILLTGDRASAAREVGDALGMDEVIAEVLPAQKLEVVRAEQAKGHVVMMVGDGVVGSVPVAHAASSVAQQAVPRIRNAIVFMVAPYIFNSRKSASSTMP